ncbi:Cleavage site for pathogenic type III effector avirulence factor Avr [Musa troglodytarum]|uniref:Cleavage site for pathogenic type III effector avirulence factor Avr n=1 Tax=Musa troglodytarum TaxID=320322 RepID=A0A9E7EK08_9LILI|nr:Cleavage site for pathogenic type III effector avirulence factor Avr [Musa troglodytarum]
MENRLENKDWMSVPQFGGWDQKTDYSMVFSRARANKKHHKAGMRPSSLGNAEEFMAYQHSQNDPSTMVNDPPAMVVHAVG